MTSLEHFTCPFLSIFSLFSPSGQNQEKDPKVQLILSVCSFIHNIVSTGSKSQHASIFMHIKANGVIDDVI